MPSHHTGRHDEAQDGERADSERSFEELSRRQRRQLEGLARLSQLSAEGPADELLQSAVDLLCEALPADCARLLAWDADQGVLSMRAVSPGDPPGEALEPLRPDSSSATGQVLRVEQSVLIEDFDRPDQPDRLAPVDADDLKSGVEAPIRGHKGVIGVLGAQSRRRTAFDPIALTFLEAVAGMAAEGLADTDRNRSFEEALASCERSMRARDEVLSIISHDLRSPASAIKLSLEVVRRAATGEKGPIPTDQVERAVDKANDNLERMLDLVDELVSLNQREVDPLDVDFEPVDLRALVEDVLLLYSGALEETGSQLNLHGADELVGRWDPTRIQQVVSNLVSNAIKYGQGSPITVDLTRRNDAAVLRVTDRGRGIPEEAQERIFERYVRLEQHADEVLDDSYGLGLWIVARIVEAHRGRLEVNSKPGEGTTFTVTLPLDPAARTEPTAKGDSTPPQPPAG